MFAINRDFIPKITNKIKIHVYAFLFACEFSLTRMLYMVCCRCSDLMAKEDWSKLGYKDLEMEKTATPIKKS